MPYEKSIQLTFTQLKTHIHSMLSGIIIYLYQSMIMKLWRERWTGITMSKNLNRVS